jgi:Cu/Ag efflux pump CusA
MVNQGDLIGQLDPAYFIAARSSAAERLDLAFWRDLQIYSPVAGPFIPLRQVVSGFATVIEDPIMMRRNRQSTITVHANPTEGLAATLFGRVRPKIEAIPLPLGYSMEWGGEYENSRDAQAALAGKLPIFLWVIVDADCGAGALRFNFPVQAGVRR